ncbi:MAG TPA: phage holin family protein [Gaiellaceae bacterium]
MHTRATTEPNSGVGPAAKQVAEHASSLARLELELAVLELKRKVAALGIGIGLGVGGLLFAVFALGFTFATIAAALATTLPTWAALLITTAILFFLAGTLAVVGILMIQKANPPVPEQAITEAKLTTEALKSDGNP